MGNTLNNTIVLFVKLYVSSSRTVYDVQFKGDFGKVKVPKYKVEWIFFFFLVKRKNGEIF